MDALIFQMGKVHIDVTLCLQNDNDPMHYSLWIAKNLGSVTKFNVKLNIIQHYFEIINNIIMPTVEHTNYKIYFFQLYSSHRLHIQCTLSKLCHLSGCALYRLHNLRSAHSIDYANYVFSRMCSNL